ncbi:MAG: ABC-type transport auxiliary lipoprotein family protein [Deltaproteobacteria bacterium]|nr:ABC-type transport auxiliary lipoprotein family protein [Deltaproteobacteria bacterium]
MKRNRCGQVLVLAILVAFTLITGCTFQSLPPVEIYTLEPVWGQSDPAPIEKKGTAIIQIAPVRGSGAFTGTDILYTDTRHTQRSYAYSRWRDSPVRMMQTVLEEAVENSGLFRVVLPPTSVSGADFLVESDLLEFGHFLGRDGASAGVVRMRFYLIDNKNRKVVDSKELVGRIPAATMDARGATAAINQAAIKVATDLVAWLSEPGRI